VQAVIRQEHTYSVRLTVNQVADRKWCITYRMAPLSMTASDLKIIAPFVDLSKCTSCTTMCSTRQLLL